MEKKKIRSSMLAILKYFTLFAFAFFLSLPLTSRLCMAANDTYRVSVTSGYLALRTDKSYDSKNEIGSLYSGDTVTVTDYSDPGYWYVYSPTLNKYGYVNKNNLVPVNSSAGNVSNWTVSVSKGYLALRSAKSYDSSNEIGQLNTGDIVQVNDSSDSTYWYVYSPKLGKYGYVNKDYLTGGSTQDSGNTRTVSVATGYLALRSAKSYDSSNEIGQLNNGDTVQLQDTTDPTYWYVYSPKLGKSGYVNKDYLTGAAIPSSGDTRTVSVATGYLALRNAKSYDSSNEIGQLNNGDTVQLQDTTDTTYWYVYSPKLGKSGYVNKDYLTGGITYPTKTVSVTTGYLALRSGKSYDSSNEIGQLNTGDIVQVMDSADASYWYVYSPKLGKSGYVNKTYLY